MISGDVKSDVRSVQEIISEVLFDYIAFVTTADYEIIDSVGRISLEDVPKNRLAADFDHWLGSGTSLLGDARTEPAGENNCFHFVVNFASYSTFKGFA